MSRPRLSDILAALAEIAPPRLAEDWDRVGLHIGDEAKAIDHLTVSLDPSLEAVEAAGREPGAGCLVCHHPLIFKPLTRLDTASPLGRVIARAIKTEVAVIAAHTNLDWTPGGVNDVLAARLGMSDIKPLVPSQDDPEAGVGRLARLEQPTTLSALAGRVRDSLGLSAVKLSGEPEAPVGLTALCGGSGGSLIHQALSAGAGLLITGEMGYHDLLEARAAGLAVIQAGHRGTEAPVVEILAEKLEKSLKNKGWSIPVSSHAEAVEPFVLI